MASDLDEFAEIHDELRSVAGTLLGKARLDEVPVPWSRLGEAGWTSLEVPEEFDGAGATFREVAIICEELGRAATDSSYLGSAVLGVAALNVLAPQAARDELLSELASAQTRVAVALSADHETVSGATAFALSGAPGGYRLDGHSDFVADAPGADRLLLLANDDAGEPVIVALTADVAGLNVEDRPVLDETRRFGRITAQDVDVADSAVWRFTGDPVARVQALQDRASVAVACDSLGLSEAMLAVTVEYAGVRQQFGRPIGSFQAVKHACADMQVHVAVARQLVTAAVNAVATGAPDAPRAVSMAKAYAGESAVTVAGAAMQLHGGIGYTWEGGVHIYLKRAALNRALFGSPAAHRSRVAGDY